MDGLSAIIMLFLAMVTASFAVSALEEGNWRWAAFFTGLSLFNIVSFMHSIQS